MSFVIRTATPQDLQSIRDHNRAMARETENRDLPLDTVTKGVQTALSDPGHGFYLVAETGGKVIANLMITYEWSDWRNGNMWWFQSVYVKPEFRGRGIFKMMYDEVMRRAGENGVKELRLYVEKENSAAQAVYKKLGMSPSHYDMYEVVV